VYLLFEFAGFSESFSDVAQNITSAAYKGVGRWVDGVRGGLRLLSDTMGPAVVPEELSMVSKPHYKAKQAIQ